MIYPLFAIYDRIAGTYGTPTPFSNRACAQRWFRVVIKQNEFAQPTDFELYELGTYDSTTGLISSKDKADFVEKGVIVDET